MNTVHIRSVLNGRRALKAATLAIAVAALPCAAAQASASSHTRHNHSYSTATVAAAASDAPVYSVSATMVVSGTVIQGNTPDDGE